MTELRSLDLKRSVLQCLGAMTPSRREAWKRLNGVPFDADLLLKEDAGDVLASLLEAMVEAGTGEKGGPRSGHREHAGRPGKVGGSLPAGSAVFGTGDERYLVWSVGPGERLPERAVDQEAAVFYDPSEKTMHVAAFYQPGRRYPLGMPLHADVMATMGFMPGDYDKMSRAVNVNVGDDLGGPYMLSMELFQVGWPPGKVGLLSQPWNLDQAYQFAEGKMKTFSSALRASGYPADRVLQLHGAGWLSGEYPLRDWKALDPLRAFLRAAKRFARGVKKEGPGRGWWGPPKGTHGAAGTGSDFERAVSGGSSDRRPMRNGGVTDATIVTYESGERGVWKQTRFGESDVAHGHDGNSEVAAYRLAGLLGEDVVPETMFDKDGKGTVQRFIGSGETGYKVAPDIQLDLLADQQNRLQTAVAMDFIMGNTDRHPGNYLFDGSGKFWAIDHGHSGWQKYSPVGQSATYCMRRNHLTMRALGLSATPGKSGMWHDGSFQFSPALVQKWGGISKLDFYGAFGGVSRSGNVKLNNGWSNLQYIIRNNGLVKWRCEK